MKHKYAIIKELAFNQYIKDYYKRNNKFPNKVTIDYSEKLYELGGKKLQIDKRYGNRLVLKYPKRMIKRNVIGIDIEKKYVKIK